MKPEPHIYTVSEITSEISNLLAVNFGRVVVRGEISGVRRPASGHVYFSLKDSRAVLGCNLWRSTLRKMKFEIEDGLDFHVHGKIDVYPPHGSYRLIVSRMEPVGLGALQLAFEQLKAKLEKEGLFAPERKKPLPFLPEKIGIATSETGAALRDMLKTLGKRFPYFSAVVAPCRVQGENAAVEIAAAIELLSRIPGVEVIITGRGGGSIEDLWPFNEEIVARVIAQSKVPVVSAVGHETDFTIADFVADARAATPTAAAGLVVPDHGILMAELEKTGGRLSLALQNRFKRTRMAIDSLAASTGLRRPLDRIRRHEQELDRHSTRLPRALSMWLKKLLERAGAAGGRLEALSPLAVLGRGYSITRIAGSGKNLKSTCGVKPGDEIETTLSEGGLRSRVESVSGKGLKSNGG